MENTHGSIYNYPIIEPFNCSQEQQAQNVMNGYLTFATNKNGPMYIGPAAQAHLLKELMEFLEVIKQSRKQFDIISKNLKFKSFEKYTKYFTTNETNKKVKLIKVLYKALYNEKNPPQLTGVLPENMILIINLKTLNEICDYLLFSLYCLYNAKNPEQKLTSLLQGQISWRDACMKKKFLNSDEYNKYEKAMGYLETLCCFSCFNLEITKNLSDEQNIVFENVLLFYMFYEALLKNCLKINIDMTIPKLDDFYSSFKVKKELYSMDEKNIIPRINDIYLKGILVSYLLMKRIGQHFEKKDGLLLTYQQYDSYIIELFSLFQKEVLDIKDKEFSFECNLKNCNLLFYNVLYYLSPKTGFILELNALDPLLFKNIIYAIFIILSNGEPIQNVEISLFPKENLDYKIDIHKIYLNYISYNNILKKRDIPKELQEIYYDFYSHDKFNWQNKDDLKLDVSENKIYDILFEDFNINLFYLLVLIDKNSQTLSEAIKINLPQCLLSKKKICVCYSIFHF